MENFLKSLDLNLNKFHQIERLANVLYIEKELTLKQENIGLNTDNPVFSWPK